MIKDAVVSECGKYRYYLSRRFDLAKPMLTIIMLNPSVADHTVDDRTIRRCISFAKNEGYGGIEVLNLFAFRSTKPSQMLRLGLAEATGPKNLSYINDSLEKVAEMGGKVLLAWGANGKKGTHQVSKALKFWGVDCCCLGKTAEGYPRHPLYVAGTQRFESYSLEEL